MMRPLLGAVFALAATAASAQPDPRAPAVMASVANELGQAGFGQGTGYAIAFTDLNDDHHQEAVVHLAGANHCGTGGCTTFVMVETPGGWQPIGRMKASRLPIYRLPEHRQGWFDLAVYVGGGGTPAGIRTVRFAKGRYGANPAKGVPIARLPQQATPVLPVTTEYFPIP